MPRQNKHLRRTPSIKYRRADGSTIKTLANNSFELPKNRGHTTQWIQRATALQLEVLFIRFHHLCTLIKSFSSIQLNTVLCYLQSVGLGISWTGQFVDILFNPISYAPILVHIHTLRQSNQDTWERMVLNSTLMAPTALMHESAPPHTRQWSSKLADISLTNW